MKGIPNNSVLWDSDSYVAFWGPIDGSLKKEDGSGLQLASRAG